MNEGKFLFYIKAMTILSILSMLFYKFSGILQFSSKKILPPSSAVMDQLHFKQNFKNDAII